MNACGITDRGLQRQLNEDSIYFSSEAVGRYPNLYIVADGMGGHQAGDFASKFTVEYVVRTLKSWEGDFTEGFRKAISGANEELLSYGSKDQKLVGMGTTLVLLSVWDDHYLAANVGDSRLYRIRAGKLSQITTDHSWVEEMYALGRLERDSEFYHAKKNIITRAVGASGDICPDFFEDRLEEGDEFILCSDGLTNMLSDEYIEQITGSSEDLIKTAGRLVTMANEAGGNDNISVILIKP